MLWARMLSIVAVRNFPELYMGLTTDRRGALGMNE